MKFQVILLNASHNFFRIITNVCTLIKFHIFNRISNLDTKNFNALLKI